MEKESILKTHLFVNIVKNYQSSPQRCKISANLMKFPASSLVLIKSNDGRQFLCRLFYFDEIFDNKNLSYFDDSVELYPRNKLNGEVKYIEEIQYIPSEKLQNFQKVHVKLLLNSSNLDLNIIKKPSDFVKISRSILVHYTFSKDCLLSIFGERFGVTKIYIHHTDNYGFGTVTKESTIVIDNIELEKLQHESHQLGGLDNAKKLLIDVIVDNRNFLKNHEHCLLKPHSQILIHGPKGTGKTSLIHHVSIQQQCNIFEITGDIFKPYPGETEEELQRFLSRIKIITKLIPQNLSIILIENVEIFCPKLDLKQKDNSHSSRIASLIYSHLDQIAKESKGILVIGTSSKIELVNIALRRISRMGIEIALDMPNESERFEIVKIMASYMFRHLKVKDIDELSKFVAEYTTGFVGADFEILFQYVLRQHQSNSNDNIYHLFERGFKNINPSVMRDNFGTVTRSTMKLNDIGGMEEVKKSLLTCILGPLKHPDKFRRFGLRSPSGILLYGPSGCAKTTIVKCLAGEAKMTLISVSSAEIYSPYVGEAEKFIVKLFNQARMSAPTILFFDEIDTIVGVRSDSKSMSSDTHTRILSTLLTEIDGFGGNTKINANKPILIIGATNRPEYIDDALMRPGRFDKLIHIAAPDYSYRLQILQFLLKVMPIDDDVDIELISKRTDFYSCADLVNLCNEAALCAATRDLNCDTISADDFENVFTFMKPSLDEKKIEFYKNFEKKHIKSHQ